MADPSPDAASQGLPPGKGSLSKGLLRSKRRADDNSRVPRTRHCLRRKRWTPRSEFRTASVYALLSLSTDMALLTAIDHKLHKIRNTQKAARRSPEGAFKRLVNDLAEEMGLDFRFHSKAYAALHEEFKSFGVGDFSGKFMITNNDMGSSLDSG